jgi:hypothetical protein
MATNTLWTYVGIHFRDTRTGDIVRATEVALSGGISIVNR